MKRTSGIHHITAIVGDPQVNMDFYAGLLGLRFVKKTINFDDPGTYHFYFGDDVGNPGTIMTFFPWSGAHRGRVGGGQVGWTTFVVPEGALPFWKERLREANVSVMEEVRFGETFLQFRDGHGLQLEIVARSAGPQSNWTAEGIPVEYAIKGFGGALLFSLRPSETGKVLEKGLGLTRVGQEGEMIRYQATGDLGQVIDLEMNPVPVGNLGAGTVHHIAWRAKDDEDHLAWRQTIGQYGLVPTEIVDRQYFNALYFRESGGILFEIATDPPGFQWDETYEKLGQELKLPAWYEPHREKIEAVLPKVIVPNGKRK
ncbi:ring-cleaving dioxygenase [Risungbinella massiliensis]|uniref:ring-cleaving dioxygenase n=1 Tax=Risungbinella massiliensis TaxID=1329796 RepID=UPI0005CC736C|nr:ring-cleaving dioxygenase [Risungbinella massiliensis]